jgi:3-oxoadipate enol-lactonase
VPRVHVNGIDIHHEVYGSEDAPWVLNIGGTGGDLRRTLPDRSPLNRAFRVLHYDQRGLGRTERLEGEYTMLDYAQDAAALIDTVIGGRCHVVGTSFGGMVALELARQRPELIDRLALLVTSPGGAHASYPLHELADRSPDEVFSTRMKLFDARWDPAADDPIPGLGPLYDIVVEHQQVELPAEVRAGLDRQLRARAGHDVVNSLAAMHHPTLVIAGSHDLIAPVENSQVISDHMPNARLEVFDGGHLLMLQNRQVWPRVVEFLGAVD